MFLVCGLDSESYSYAYYKVVKTLDKAKELANDLCSEYEGDVEPFDKYLDGYRQSIDDGKGNFFVVEVKEISDVECVCVKHHAYNGVDFTVVATGNYVSCKTEMNNDALEFINDLDIPDEDVSIYKDQIIVDDGQEWNVWDIEKVR